MTDLSIRPATINDIPWIHTSFMAMAEEQGVLERFAPTPETFSEYLFTKNKEQAEVIIAMIDDEKAGLALFGKTIRNFNLFEKPGLYLHDIYVLPAQRKKGVGAFLLDSLYSIAKLRNCGRIDWIVLKDNASALNFYKRYSNQNKTIKVVDYIDTMRLTVD